MDTRKNHRVLVVAAIATVTLIIGACDSVKEPPRPLTAEEQALVTASNGFGLELFDAVIDESDGDNLFISPLSVSMALGMAYNGALGSTEEGMREALSFGDLTSDQINENYRSLIDLLIGMDRKVTMEIANSIWYSDEFTVFDEFIATCEAYFAAVVSSLDFAAPSASSTINDWVSEHTGGKITDIVDSPIDPATVMFLINAVYFKADWTCKFDEEATYDETFHIDDETDKTVKMMVLDSDGLISRVDQERFQAFSLTYGSGYFAMTILLPKEEVALDDVAAELTPEIWRSTLDGLYESDVTFKMPRFEMEFDTSLVDVLSTLGMEVAFIEGEADFGKMSPDQQLFISEVKHKSWIRVDEEGTEAAAATSVEIDAGASMPEEIVIDRPFIFVIHDHHSGALIFMGKVVDPPSV